MNSPATADHILPLQGIKVIEFSHMVMGPTCGMILGDLGADVIKVEPIAGDNTRTLTGGAAGFFRTFNRNKRSVSVDMNSPEGLAVIKDLIAGADVVLENFRPGHMARFGLDYASLAESNPRLVYLSLKGFLPGPYEHRTALDEVVQMMGGLAYMTGPIGRPLRAGSSVNDIMGGMFGVIGVQAALRERDITGRGQEVQASLFESCVLLAAQHMQQYHRTGEHPLPLPNRKAIFAIYDIFEAAGGDQIFIAIVSDRQWRIFCENFPVGALADDPRLASNQSRAEAREWLLPELGKIFGAMAKDDIFAVFERIGLPFADIKRPEDLFDDPQVKEGMAPMITETGESTSMPLLPLLMQGERLRPRMDLPRVGQQSEEVLREYGYSAERIAELAGSGAIRTEV